MITLNPMGIEGYIKFEEFGDKPSKGEFTHTSGV